MAVQEKDREKKEKDKEGKEKDKKVMNGHLFTSVSLSQAAQCSQCNKTFSSKEAFHCTCKSLSLFLTFILFIQLCFVSVQLIIVCPTVARSCCLSLIKAH